LRFKDTEPDRLKQYQPKTIATITKTADTLLEVMPKSTRCLDDSQVAQDQREGDNEEAS